MIAGTWKYEIARLGLDFIVNRFRILEVIRGTEEKYGNSSMPSYYNGNRDEYLYDIAHRALMSYVYEA